jgi:hypothetical protein
VPTFLGSVENVFEIDQFFRYYSETSNEETADGVGEEAEAEEEVNEEA